jgi:DNA-binding CsgD family transcriptional regulator
MIPDRLGLVDQIYEAGAVAETWPSVLDVLSERYSCTGAVLFTFGPSGSQNWIATPALRPLLDEFIRDGWAELNDKPRRISALNYAGFINDLDVFTPEEIERDRVYKEFYPPRNLGWAAGAMIPSPSGDTLIFSFERAFRLGPFEDHELIALDALRPHLARAALLSSRLDLQRAKAMTAALEAIGLPAAVLQQGGRLYAANPSFQRLIPATVQDRSSRIAFADGPADLILEDTLQRLEVSEALGQSRSIPIPASEGSPPMIAHIAPVRGAANDIFSKSLALLLITPVDRNSVPTAEVLQGLFDLTPAEARVARGIAEGKTVDAISLTYGTSRETVRKQLAAVLGKSGVSRQAELVALLSGTGMTEAADE